eukprot:1429464-Rhodomonas_salina.1
MACAPAAKAVSDSLFTVTENTLHTDKHSAQGCIAKHCFRVMSFHLTNLQRLFPLPAAKRVPRLFVQLRLPLH